MVFGYACHNTTLDGYQWCGDYAGYAQIGVEKAFPGAVAMFWTGCGATRTRSPRRKVELCEQHGKELADAVVATVKGQLKPITGKFAAKYETITLKFESVPTKAQLTADTLSKTLAVEASCRAAAQGTRSDGQDRRHVPALPGASLDNSAIRSAGSRSAAKSSSTTRCA